MHRFLQQRCRSFAHALRGIQVLLGGEVHARIHAIASVVVIAVGLMLPLSRMEWALLFFAIGVVWLAEAFNAGLERLCDRVSSEWDAQIRDAKDLAAAAVLLAALTASAIGALVLLPHLFT